MTFCWEDNLNVNLKNFYCIICLIILPRFLLLHRPTNHQLVEGHFLCMKCHSFIIYETTNLTIVGLVLFVRAHAWVLINYKWKMMTLQNSHLAKTDKDHGIQDIPLFFNNYFIYLQQKDELWPKWTLSLMLRSILCLESNNGGNCASKQNTTLNKRQQETESCIAGNTVL